MSKNQVPTFTEPERLEPHDVPSGTIGVDVVQAVDEATRYDFEGSVAQSRIEYADELSQVKSEPGPNRIRNFAGRIVGKVMTEEEKSTVNHARSHDESYVELKQELAAKSKTAAENELPWIRRKFTTLDEYQAKDLDDYLDAETAPFLKNLAREDNQDNRSWSHWLANQATDEQLTNFLQWNVARTAERQQSPEFTEAVEQGRTQFKELVPKRVAEGWLSERVLEGLDEKVDKTSVYVLDPLETVLHGRRGESKHNEITIGLPDDGDIANEVALILPHELAHQTLQNVYGEELERKWVVEALTELVACTMRPKDPKVYPHELTLLAGLMVGGAKQLDLRLATRAYSGTKEDKEAFYKALDESWGVPNALEKVSDYVTEMQKAGKPGDRFVRQEAPRYAAVALEHKPEYIFGDDYQKPQSSAAARSHQS